MNKTNEPLSLRFNAPNVVTGARLVMAALIAWLLLQGNTNGTMLAGILFIVAWATDWLDGFLARRLGQSTVGGAIFDLVADRLLMTPLLIISIVQGVWWQASSLLPLGPYPYAVVVVAADLTILAGIVAFVWKRRHRDMEFPRPTMIAKITYSIQVLTLAVGLLGIGPGVVLAALMYLTTISTIVAFYSYFRKGGYVFSR